MRLAEFKSRLFIFFAGRLLKWVESVEPKIKYGQSPPATPVDDSNAVLFAKSARESEAASGPPDHWARILASGPPKHWLDLIGEKGPHLLPPPENNVISPQAGTDSLGLQDFPKETNQEAAIAPASEKSEGKRSQPPLLHPGPTRRETKYSAVKLTRSSWLNRLRFQPPARRTEGLEPIYISDAKTGNSDTSQAAGGAAEEGSESTLQRPTLSAAEVRYLSPDPGPAAARNTIPNLSSNPGNEKAEDDRDPRYQAGGDHAELRPDYSASAREAWFSSPSEKQTGPEQTRPATLRDTVHSTRSNNLRERGQTYASGTRARSSNDSIREHYLESSPQPIQFGELDRERGVNREERAGPASSPRVFHQMREEHTIELDRAASWIEKDPTRTRPIPTFRQGREVIVADDASNVLLTPTMANSRIRNQALSSSRPAINVAAADEQASKKFASVEPGAPTSNESKIEPRENLWPTLPPMPDFDTADELAAMDQEAEGRRRLDQEQRGTLWNA